MKMKMYWYDLDDKKMEMFLYGKNVFSLWILLTVTFAIKMNWPVFWGFFTYEFYIRNKISIYFYFENLIQFLKNYSCPIDVQLNS